MPDTTLTTPSGEVGAYLAVPSGDPPWPGGFALLAAPRGWFQAASVNYGVVPKDADALLRGA